MSRDRRSYLSYRRCVSCEEQTVTLVTYSDSRTELICQVCGEKQELPPVRKRAVPAPYQARR